MDTKYSFLKKESLKLKEKISKLLKNKKSEKDENEIRYLINLLEQTTNKMELIINSRY